MKITRDKTPRRLFGLWKVLAGLAEGDVHAVAFSVGKSFCFGVGFPTGHLKDVNPDPDLPHHEVWTILFGAFSDVPKCVTDFDELLIVAAPVDNDNHLVIKDVTFYNTNGTPDFADDTPVGAGNAKKVDWGKIPRLANLFLCTQPTTAEFEFNCNTAEIFQVLGQPIKSADPKCTGFPNFQDPATCPRQQLGAFEYEVRFDPKLVDVQLVPLVDLGGRENVQCFKNTGEGFAQLSCVTKGKDSPIFTPAFLSFAKITPKPDLFSLLIANQGNGIATQLINQGCQLADLQGHPIPLDGLNVCQDGAVTIRYLEGDVHADCVVDVHDQQQIAFRWGARLGNLLYNSRFDLEPSAPKKGDGDIDAKDLQAVYGRHGSTCHDPHPKQDPVDPKAKVGPPTPTPTGTPTPATPTVTGTPTPTEQPADFGDAPEDDELFFCSGFPTHYPSRRASGGPFHDDFTDVWLGAHPNNETAEADAILPNCDDWIAAPFDVDDGCIVLLIGGPGSGWVCQPKAGGAVFGPPPVCPVKSSTGLPGGKTEEIRTCPSFWVFQVSVGGGAPLPADKARFANVVVDCVQCPLSGAYGDSPIEWVLVNGPVTALPGGTQIMVTLPFPVDVAVILPPPPPTTQLPRWGVLPFWTRFMVSQVFKDPAVPWDGTGPPFKGPGETEDWLVFGDPDATPSNPALEAAIAAHAAEFGVPEEQIVGNAKDFAIWPDSCLGLPEPGEACREENTPGFRIVLKDERLINCLWRTNVDGSNVRLEGCLD